MYARQSGVHALSPPQPSQPEGFLRATLDALEANIAVLDEAGTIVAVNAGWEAFAHANGLELPDEGLGSNYLEVCDGASGDDSFEATAAATELAASLDGLRDALRKAPPPGIGGGMRSRHELRDRLRLMENESKHLAAELKDGQGRDATYPVFQRINSIRRDAVDDAQRMYLQQPVLDKIESAREPLEKLAGYYGVKLDHQLEVR